MKKYLILSAFFSLVLTGCQDNTNTENGTIYDANKTGAQIRNDVINNAEPNVILDKYLPQDNISGEQSGEDSILENTSKMPKENLASHYKTKILTSDKNRYKNITIVADRLNNKTLKPGESFSFNNICGPYGKDDGFLEAEILLSNGKSSKGYGGGVCQLSTTLYNAVKTLDIDITERHNHSTLVAYAPEKEDATVSLESGLDFKFKNTSDKILTFKTIYDPDNLEVYVYAE